MPFKRKRRRGRRTHMLGAAAAAATAALAGVEIVHRRVGVREAAQVLREGYRAGTANEAALLNLFVAFGGTFGIARAVTYTIRRGGPIGNVHIGRRHIHHFVPGIVLVLLAGGVSIGARHEGIDTWLAFPFGTGAALILDETALLLELEDVYWSEEGILSIDVALGGATVLAVIAMLVRLARRGLAREELSSEA